MATRSSPAEVGARGTIGSLVLQEIEFFRELDLHRQGRPRKPKIHLIDGGVASRSSSSNLDYRGLATKKKKATGGGGLLPSICSLVEIADNGRTDRAPRIGYKNLKLDRDRSPQH